MDILDAHIPTIHAIANRVIPPDDTPGAGENESIQHVAEVLTGEMSARLPELRRMLDRLNVSAKVHHQRRFDLLDATVQDELLHSVEDEPIFKALCDLIHQGYWASEAGQKTAGFEVKG
jgi:Gluconate 2-dehydrogenase subunit 3